MKREVVQVIIVSIVVILISLLYFFYPATDHSYHLQCPFHYLTGLYCPGCGSQRAFSALLKGDIAGASGKNVLMVASLPLIACSAFVFTWNAFSKTKIQQRLFYSPLFVRIVLALVLLFGVLRNIPVEPFTWLAP